VIIKVNARQKSMDLLAVIYRGTSWKLPQWKEIGRGLARYSEMRKQASVELCAEKIPF
tara:strand:+ start:4569 stop:4742 length:174 start_codon:yes stop_codon:yes gene_type:complete